jgi:hypothetical protein
LVEALAGGVQEILARLLPIRRRRSNPRVVKRKMSSFPLKRTRHRDWPRPTRDPAEAFRIASPYRAVSASKHHKWP